MWPLFIHSLADQDVLAIRGFTFKLLGGFSPFPLVRESPFAGLWDPEGFFAPCLSACAGRIMISLPNIGSAHTFSFFNRRSKPFAHFGRDDAAHNYHSASQRKFASIWVLGMPERTRATRVAKADTQSVIGQPVIGPAERESPMNLTRFPNDLYL